MTNDAEKKNGADESTVGMHCFFTTYSIRCCRRRGRELHLTPTVTDSG
jgi:hypothetical protein